ncbi:FAR1 DNA binding domain, zinc finger, SWIM-type, MULE transposase domain containing protein [Tanacetum coccineum]|uniref:FAR1 DNA binding domain, zinc finger, SWIM-type, MULE transposase domain containing protein n=1 Tax=Tanacetum coccineum TaxID=301880 RepID=A0ABQ4WJW8_9ASTR
MVKTLGIVRVKDDGVKFYKPDVPDCMKPLKGKLFNTLEDALHFYRTYAKLSGFEARKSTEYKRKDGKIKQKYFVCSREGFKLIAIMDTLVDNLKSWKLRRKSEKEKDLHVTVLNNNIGLMKAFKMMKELFGGFDKVGATSVDCKNFRRGINLFIGEYDGKMVVELLMNKQEYINGFSCDYFTNDDGNLSGLFWADEVAKHNYLSFGDCDNRCVKSKVYEWYWKSKDVTQGNWVEIVRIALRILVDSRRMSTPVFVDPEISTQADGAQSSRVPVPLPEDPYEAIRQAYLDGTDTESEPFEDPVETETPESPLTVAPPTSLPESTPLILAPILRRTARMAVRYPPAMSSGLSTSMAEVATMSESAFRKRFRSFYDSSPFSSPPDLPSQKRYRGTSELVEDDEEIEESLDSDSVSEDTKDEGPTAEDEDPVAGDEGLAAGDESPSIGVESHGLDAESRGLDVESRSLDDESRGLDDKGHSVESDGLGLGEEEEAVPGGQGSRSAPEPERPERVSVSRQPTLTKWTDPEDGIVYIDVPAYPPPAPPV